MIITTVFAPYLAPYNPLKVNIPEKTGTYQPEASTGNCAWGRDLLSRVIFGGRYSLAIDWFR